MYQSDRGWQSQLRRVSLVVLGSAAILALDESAIAQVIPDNTLDVEKSDLERIDEKTENITGGARRGDNLFHSFREFNIGEGNGIYFANPDGVRNIFSRVTGTNASNILGKLGVLGNANLFFMNPNGIIFGANASLDIRGSFLATTANSLIFDNGFEFSANSSEEPPLLTVNVPIGLQFGENPGSIHVRDEPNQSLSKAIDELGGLLSNLFDREQSFNSDTFVGEGTKLIFGVLNDLSRNPGLQVQPGRTLAFVGGNIVLEGGILTAERIELGSVADNGRVSLTPTSDGFTLGYENVLNFGNIDIFQQSLMNISGSGSSNVRVQGNRVTFQDSSAIFAVTLTNRSRGEGEISIQAQHLNITSNANISAIASGGKSPDVTIETGRLNVQDSFIGSFSIGQGNTGNITVQATDFVNLIRTPSNQLLPSGIFNITTGVNEGGKLTIQTRQLTIRDGAQVAVSTAGVGQGGTVSVNASDVELIGESANNEFPSGIFASSFDRGAAGSLYIETQRLTVRDGANVAASTRNGLGGTVVVKASDFVRVIGTSANRGFPSDISANTRSGQAAGDVRIEAGQLIVEDGGQITAAALGLQGTGAAGNITIEADSIYLDNQGAITTETQAGEFGNIELQSSQFLLLRRGSRITTNATGTATGGNINIDAPFIIAVPSENSDITANAIEGRGGKITINTQGIYGLQFRENQTDLSDITVTSKLGVAGIVNITSPEVDPNQGLVNLLVLPETTEVVQACSPSGNNTSEFTVTGRGGLPPAPQETLNNEPMGVDWVALPNQSSTSSKKPDLAPIPDRIIEAQGWVVEADGKVILVAQADPSTHSWQKPLNCHDN